MRAAEPITLYCFDWSQTSSVKHHLATKVILLFTPIYHIYFEMYYKFLLYSSKNDTAFKNTVGFVIDHFLSNSNFKSHIILRGTQEWYKRDL